MWSYRNTDVVLNAFQNLPIADYSAVTLAFRRFLTVCSKVHPCSIDSKRVTRLKFDGEGDRFVLLLPSDWTVAYRVSPECAAESGDVHFLAAGPFPVFDA
jgi:hypothetical protein